MKTTPLHPQHLALQAKMAEFAGYDMPIQYPLGVLGEHNWTREKCGVFDVSHMGQIWLSGSGAAALWDRLTPSAISALKPNMAKYSVMTNEEGGIVDDLIITRLADDRFFAVINAGCKDKDITWIESHLPDGVTLTHHTDRALIAVQGPLSERVVREALEIDCSNLGYMRYMEFGACWISRLGYTGEDGFEISMPNDHVAEGWQRLLQHPDVKPVGLAARDSLRLEMGYPLYGHDITAATSPVEAGLTWIFGKGEHDYIGRSIVQKHAQHGAQKTRVGVKLTDKGIAREGAEIFSTTGEKLGDLTSGGFSPALNAAIGQGYILRDKAKQGDEVLVRVRGRDIRGVLCPMPFVPAKTKAAQKPKAA